MSDEANKLIRLMLERLCEEAAERGYCVFCTMVCRLQHDHEFENERYCEEAHGDECIERPLTAYLARPPGTP